MPDAPVTEAERVLIYRLERLLDAGLDYPEALELAMSNADIHVAEEMTKAGCTPALLARILG